MRSFFVLLALAGCPVGTATKAPGRYAVLLGNAQYSKLPAFDAASANLDLLAPALTNAGFKVRVIAGLNMERLSSGIETGNLFEGLNSGDVCFFYYTGYAIQSNGENWIVPSDFDPENKDQFRLRAVSLEVIQRLVEQKSPAIKMFVIDAPAAPEALVAVARSVGLGYPGTMLESFKETLVAFPSLPDGVLPDAPPSGPTAFTKSIADAIAKEGLDVDATFAEAKAAVIQATGRQFSHPSNVTQRTFFFHDPPPPKPAELPPGLPRRNRIDKQEYVYIPSGKFLMGCVPGDKLCDDDEKPQHPVAISRGFWMAEKEVMVDAYKRYLEQKGDPKHKRMPEAPVWDRKWMNRSDPMNNVTWEEASGYCQWAGGRLPTEAEWEYAARDGKDNEIYPLNDENSRDRANFAGTSGTDHYEHTSPVGTFDPSPHFHLFDMAGNVWEWVSDSYSKTYYADSPQADPKGPSDGHEHVARGGSFDSDPHKHLRISIRMHWKKTGQRVGFRCVLDDTPETKKNLQ
jgi:formylglycine-generating enzyme required for sulfatase activity